jgi:type II secretory pathway predicted ATPase ExeA
LKALLARPELHQFTQRIGVDFFLPPLRGPEVTEYIRYRLSVAGRKQDLFTDDAIALISHVSGGVPRSINILCDTALVYGYAAEAAAIDSGLVQEVLQDRKDYGILRSDPA